MAAGHGAVEDLGKRVKIAEQNKNFWKGRTVFVTGHTGFKGSWLSLMLAAHSANVTGYALAPHTRPSLFERANVARCLSDSTVADIRDRTSLLTAMKRAQPEIVFHLAAQPLVLNSYDNPLETYEVNVMGTANTLDACRFVESVKAIVVVTTDKVYENLGWEWGYRENDRLGGSDPYSNSKACCELLVQAYRRSFFSPGAAQSRTIGLATARAGNVIGGGDWSPNRLVPDVLKAVESCKPLQLRYPHATRPWQHVLEPLSGYIRLGEKLLEAPAEYSDAWNFSPRSEDVRDVLSVVEILRDKLNHSLAVEIADCSSQLHEAALLNLDSSKAIARLNWMPRWSLDDALTAVVDFWEESQRDGDLREVCLRQIAQYSTASLQPSAKRE